MQTDYLHRMYASVIPVHTPEAIWYGRSWNASGGIFPLAYVLLLPIRILCPEEDICGTALLFYVLLPVSHIRNC